MLVTLLHGAATGASLNYTLVHLLHVTPPATHFIATSVVAMTRGFAGSFGSAIGGGIFVRVLRAALERGFTSRGVRGQGELVRKLLGSPRLVAELEGVERIVAVEGYQTAVRSLFLVGAGLAVVATVLQAFTGWTEPGGGKVEEHEEVA